jgi:hypothetical protein
MISRLFQGMMSDYIPRKKKRATQHDFPRKKYFFICFSVVSLVSVVRREIWLILNLTLGNSAEHHNKHAYNNSALHYLFLLCK